MTDPLTGGVNDVNGETEVHVDREWEICAMFYGPTVALAGCPVCDFKRNERPKGGADDLQILLYLVLWSAVLIFVGQVLNALWLFQPAQMNDANTIQSLEITFFLIGIAVASPLGISIIFRHQAVWDALYWVDHFRFRTFLSEEVRTGGNEIVNISGVSTFRRLLRFFCNTPSQFVVVNGRLTFVVHDSLFRRASWARFLLSYVHCFKSMAVCFTLVFFPLFALLNLFRKVGDESPFALYLVRIHGFRNGLAAVWLCCLGFRLTANYITGRYIRTLRTVWPDFPPEFPFMPDGRQFICDPTFAYFSNRCLNAFRIPASSVRVVELLRLGGRSDAGRTEEMESSQS
ncbi:lanthionine synthetase [Babesia caballi]|uniref:Lanthionine synthetase n=1 Tax=Babesia caballi TaxID=5871 RepID=A0AAV4LU81_BABCB|nr:lanthionine synthetase [Babesia caballi]